MNFKLINKIIIIHLNPLIKDFFNFLRPVAIYVFSAIQKSITKHKDIVYFTNNLRKRKRGNFPLYLFA